MSARTSATGSRKHASRLRNRGDAFRKTVDLNVWAPILWSCLAARAWMSEHGGAIVNTASLGRIGEPEDIGRAIAFLASVAAAWITGQILVIDGGAML